MAERNEFSEVIVGFFELFALHFMAIFLVGLFAYLSSSLFRLLKLGYLESAIGIIWVYFVFGIGISQLLYVIPYVLYLKKQRKFGRIKGIIIAAVITALLNGFCYIVITSSYG